MLKEFGQTLGHYILHLFSSTITEIGIGTLVFMGLTFFLASRQRRHSMEQSDSKDHRETAYQSLLHAVDRFTQHKSTESPMRLRSDWATLAHALEMSEVLAQEIIAKKQKKIWATQLEYFRRVMLSEFKTEEAFLCSLAESPNRLSRFNHQPAERHVAPVMRWVLRLEPSTFQPNDLLTQRELAKIAERGLPSLANQIRLWRMPVES